MKILLIMTFLLNASIHASSNGKVPTDFCEKAANKFLSTNDRNRSFSRNRYVRKYIAGIVDMEQTFQNLEETFNADPPITNRQKKSQIVEQCSKALAKSNSYKRFQNNLIVDAVIENTKDRREPVSYDKNIDSIYSPTFDEEDNYYRDDGGTQSNGASTEKTNNSCGYMAEVGCHETKQCAQMSKLLRSKINPNDSGKPYFTELKLCKNKDKNGVDESMGIAFQSLNLLGIIKYSDLKGNGVCGCIKDKDSPFNLDLDRNLPDSATEKMGKGLRTEMIKEIKNDYSNHIENMASFSFSSTGDARDITGDSNGSEESRFLCYDEMDAIDKCSNGKGKIDQKDLVALLGGEDWGWDKEKAFVANGTNPLKVLKENMVNHFDVINQQDSADLYRVDPSLGVLTGVTESLIGNTIIHDKFKTLVRDEGLSYFNAVETLIADKTTGFSDLVKGNYKFYKNITHNTKHKKLAASKLSDKDLSKLIQKSLLRANRVSTNTEYLMTDSNYALDFVNGFKDYSETSEGRGMAKDFVLYNFLTKDTSPFNKSDGKNDGIRAKKIKAECGKIVKKIEALLCNEDKDLASAEFLPDSLHVNSYENIIGHFKNPDALLGLSCQRLENAKHKSSLGQIFNGAPGDNDISGVSDTYICQNQSNITGRYGDANAKCSENSVAQWYKDLEERYPDDVGNIVNTGSTVAGTSGKYKKSDRSASKDRNKANRESNKGKSRKDTKASNYVISSDQRGFSSAGTSGGGFESIKKNVISNMKSFAAPASVTKEEVQKKMEVFENTIQDFVKSPEYQGLNSKDKDEFAKQIADMKSLYESQLKEKDLKIANLKNEEL
jgi:hypothetical protein